MRPPPAHSQRASLVTDQDRELIARHIRTEMAKRALTQGKLADLSAYDERTIRNVLKAQPVKDATLFEICASLQIDLAKLPLARPIAPENREIHCRRAERASIAVLPFQNLSDEDGQDYFVDGVVEDIIVELSRFSEFVVIARNSTFQFKGKVIDVREAAQKLGARYVVEGSVRRSKQRVRITAQLIDADTGTHLWAERYDCELKDVFSTHDEVAQAIASVLVAHVRRAEPARTLNKPPEKWDAYDFYLRAADLFSAFPNYTNVERIYEARRLLHRALELDPNYARAHALLAATYMATWVNPLDNDLLNPEALERAHRSAQTAVQLDPNLPQGHGELGHVLLHKRQHDAAIGEFERACKLNPNFIHWRHGAALIFAGEPAKAIDVLKSQMLRDPFYPVQALSFLGYAYFVARRYEEAIPSLREAIHLAPDFRPARVFLAATFGRLGRFDEAKAEATEVLRVDPRFTISGRLTLTAPFKHENDYRHLADSLRAAGLPD